MAIGRKTGGRQKGSRNKKTIAQQEEIAATGETPLQYMIRIMRDPQVEHPRRDEMAKAAAPYVHARLAATDVNAEVDGTVQVHTVADLLKAVEGKTRGAMNGALREVLAGLSAKRSPDEPGFLRLRK